ncbi:zf-CSL-domain-containing protein [Hypoxylon sp. FL1284]|nr:zf-CSL-domain-containing protein [Hypoxylon sp. FL1284]
MADDDQVAIYDEVEIEDMTFDKALEIYHYPCPCGDRFQIALADLRDEATDIAVCPSCSLMIRVIYDLDNLPKLEPEPDPPAPETTEQADQQVPIAA